MVVATPALRTSSLRRVQSCSARRQKVRLGKRCGALSPRALRAISDNVDRLAADVVTAALERGEVDGVQDLAYALPPCGGSRHRRLVAHQRDNLLSWGAATFDVLLTAADKRKLSYAECAPLMIDYIAPSLDTTISSISSALYLFATHPKQWQILKDDPSLIANAVNEVVRAQQHHPSP